MTNGDRPILYAVGILVLGALASAVANPTEGGSPYQAIVDRNVFGLKPPAPPPGPEDNKPPPAKLTLTGVYKWGTTARALIKVAVPPRPPDPAKEIPLILSEGQGGEGVEVLSIDTVASTVKVNNSGTVMTLDFTNNGAKLAGGPSGGPGAAGKPPGVGMPPAPNPFAPPAPGPPPSTARPVRPTGMPGAPVSPTSAAAQSVTTYTALPTASTYNTASGALNVSGMASAASAPQGQRNWPPEPRTAEEAAIMGAAYSVRYAKEIQAGSMPSIPGGNPLLPDQQETTPTTPPVNTPAGPPLPPGSARAPF
jgi:hypothetical protein